MPIPEHLCKREETRTGNESLRMLAAIQPGSNEKAQLRGGTRRPATQGAPPPATTPKLSIVTLHPLGKALCHTGGRGARNRLRTRRPERRGSPECPSNPSPPAGAGSRGPGAAAAAAGPEPRGHREPAGAQPPRRAAGAGSSGCEPSRAEPCYAVQSRAVPCRAEPCQTMVWYGMVCRAELCRALPPDCRTGLRRTLVRSKHKRGMQLAAQGTVNKVLGESETIKGPEQIQRRELPRAGRHSPGKVPLWFGRAAGRKAVLERPGGAGQAGRLPCPPRFCLSGPAVLALRGSHAHFRDAHAGDMRVSRTVARLRITPWPCQVKHGAWESVSQPSQPSRTPPCGVSSPIDIDAS